MERQNVAKVQKTASPQALHRKSAPPPAAKSPMMGLQESIGNQAVQRLMRSSYIQAKLQVSSPGDPFEQEADRTAETVMRSAGTAGPISGGLGAGISRTASASAQRAEQDSEQTVQRASRSPLVQHPQPDEEFAESGSPLRQHPEETDSSRSPLLQYSQLDDCPVHRKTEGEEVQRDPAGPEMPTAIARKADEEPLSRKEEEPVSRKEDEPLARKEDEPLARKEEEPLSRKEEEPLSRKEEEPLSRKEEEPLSRKEEEQEALMPAPENGKAPAVPRGFGAEMQRQSSSGAPVPGGTREFMEDRFGVNFESVRIHTGSDATKLNRSIHAKAFTRANHIYFADGSYDPSSSSGQTLLAHELTHVVQQGYAPAAGPSAAATPASPAAAPAASAAPTGAVQREADDDAPTEEERAIALAKAARAAKVAETAKVVGQKEIAKSKQEKTEKKKEEQEEKQNVKAAVGKSKANKAKKKKGKTGGRVKKAVVAGPEAEAGGAAEGAKKAPASPEEDPAFQAVVVRVGGVATKQKAHVPAKEKADEAQAAAEMPPEETTGRAEDVHAGSMEKAETPPPFDAAAFKAQLMKRIEELSPKTLEEADDFKDNNKLGSVKQEVNSSVAEGKAASRGPLEKTKAAGPDLKAVDPKAVTPIPDAAPGAPPPGVGAAEAAPKQKTAAEIEAPIAENTARVGDEMASAGVTEEQLANSNEPSFQGALEEKRAAETQAAEGPAGYRKFEEKQLGSAEKQAAGTAATRTKGMHAGRAEAFGQVREMQTSTKSKDEAARLKVGTDIDGIYQKAAAEVERILGELDGKVETAFDTGAEAAKTAFQDYVDAQMEAYKEERYGGWFGWARWASDKIWGMPEEVNRFYERGRNLYLGKMDEVLDTVVAIIGADLTAAKAAIATGRTEITEYLAGLPASLQTVGAEAAEEASGKFDTLEENVNSKQNQLIDTLANKYNEHLKAVDASIEEMKAANMGLVDKAIAAVKAIINTIIELKNLLFRVLAKIADVVVDIISDPIGFLSNMIDAVKLGINNFGDNIEKHLQAGFITWLTGSLGNVNIKMPDDVFSLPGIFSLIMQVLGLTWDYVRGKAVKLLGEPVVQALEVGFDIFQILIKEGPAGLWAYAAEKFSDLKELVIEEIKNMLITEVIKAGIKWLLSMLNPVAAFIKAAMAIYEIVSFFISKAKQIMELIEAFIDGIAAVAKGSITGAAALIEGALAKAIPLIIGFLASLLGISGLATRVQNLIKSLRKRVDKFIDGIILKAKAAARSVLAKVSPDKRGKVVDDKEEKKHQTIGKAVAAKMAEPPPGELPYPELRAKKQEQADSLTEKYNKELTPPVKLKIIFGSPKEDEADNDLDFKVHIGPNDFDLKGAVAGGGHAPIVGRYRAVKKLAPDGTEVHHVPPKGLLGWLRWQAEETVKKPGIPGSKDLEKHDWLTKMTTILTDDVDPGWEIAALSIDKHTHIKKTGIDAKDQYRAHWGKETARIVFERLKGQKLGLIYRLKYDELDPEDRAEWVELAEQADEDPGVGVAATAAEEAAIPRKSLSTQFFKTELNTALEAARADKANDLEGLRLAMGSVAKHAYLQSREAVTVALEHSSTDGTPDQRAAALEELKGVSTESWNKQPGVDKMNMF